jgi:hypothetical protein
MRAAPKEQPKTTKAIANDLIGSMRRYSQVGNERADAHPMVGIEGRRAAHR